MKTLVLAAALAGTTLGAAAVYAQTPPTPMAPTGGDRMMRGDTDGDGRISRAEAMAEADARFARMDVNGDGKLTPDEMQPRGHRGGGGDMPPPPPPPGADGAPPPPPAMAGGRGMHRDDANGDGMVTRDEFRERAMKRFDRLDANRDGFIDPSEIQAMRDRMMQMRERRDGGDTPPPPAPQNPGQ